MGTPGDPPVMAKLSDPFAIPNLDYVEQVDIIFRHVTNALINGHENASFETSKLYSNFYFFNFD